MSKPGSISSSPELRTSTPSPRKKKLSVVGEKLDPPHQTNTKEKLSAEFADVVTKETLDTKLEEIRGDFEKLRLELRLQFREELEKNNKKLLNALQPV